jgi:aldehyde:ferredoxin oxidoreductase
MAGEMFGYTGKSIIVDLTTRKITEIDTPEDVISNYIGGYGYGVPILWEELKPHTDPLGPDNILIFATGPLTGTLADTSGRAFLVFKSALTGTIGPDGTPLSATIAASSAGGHFASELKYAGYDYLVIKGKAEKPVYLWIDDDTVEIRDASDMWGYTTLATDSTLKEKIGDNSIATACIGPAGEKLTRISSVMLDVHCAFGRGGSGAVAGSKNLKAIAVRGTKGLRVKDMERLKKAHDQQIKEAKERDPEGWESLRKFGTSFWMDLVNNAQFQACFNFKRGHWDKAKGLYQAAYTEKLGVRPWSKFNCSFACCHYGWVRSGPYAGIRGSQPEYESASAFGTKCGIDDLGAVMKANELVTLYGLDVISTGQSVASAMEWYEEGIITKEDTGGLELNFGNAKAMVALVEKIGRREGLGDLLAEGSWRAARKIGKGAEKYVMTIKKQEISAEDMRGSKGMATTFMTNERGAHHMEPYSLSLDAGGYNASFLGIDEPLDALEDNNKGWVYAFKKYAHLANLLGICAFHLIDLQVSPSTMAELFSAATGIEKTGDDLVSAADRFIVLERAFNAREGFRRIDDETIPDRFTKDPYPEEYAHGQVVKTKPNLDSYYRAAGLDIKTGIPTESKFKQVGLAKVADKLKAEGVPISP